MALLHILIQKLCHYMNSPRLAKCALVLGPYAALNKNPTAVTSVNNTSQAVPQPSVSQQPSTSEPLCLLSWSKQRELLPLKSHQKDLLQIKMAPI